MGQFSTKDQGTDDWHLIIILAKNAEYRPDGPGTNITEELVALTSDPTLIAGAVMVNRRDVPKEKIIAMLNLLAVRNAHPCSESSLVKVMERAGIYADAGHCTPWILRSAARTIIDWAGKAIGPDENRVFHEVRGSG